MKTTVSLLLYNYYFYLYELFCFHSFAFFPRYADSTSRIYIYRIGLPNHYGFIILHFPERQGNTTAVQYHGSYVNNGKKNKHCISTSTNCLRLTQCLA